MRAAKKAEHTKIIVGGIGGSAWAGWACSSSRSPGSSSVEGLPRIAAGLRAPLSQVALSPNRPKPWCRATLIEHRHRHPPARLFHHSQGGPSTVNQEKKRKRRDVG